MSRLNHLRRGEDRANLAKVGRVFASVIWRIVPVGAEDAEGRAVEALVYEDRNLREDDPYVYHKSIEIFNVEPAARTGYISVGQRAVARYTQAVHQQIVDTFTTDGQFSAPYEGRIMQVRYRVLQSATESVLRVAEDGVRELILRGDGDCVARLFQIGGTKSATRKFAAKIPIPCSIGQLEDLAREHSQSYRLVNHCDDVISEVECQGSRAVRGVVFGDHVCAAMPVVDRLDLGDCADVSMSGFTQVSAVSTAGVWRREAAEKTVAMCAELNIADPYSATYAWVKKWHIPRSTFSMDVADRIVETVAVAWSEGELCRGDRPHTEFVERDFVACYRTVLCQMPIPYSGVVYTLDPSLITGRFISRMALKMSAIGCAICELDSLESAVSAIPSSWKPDARSAAIKRAETAFAARSRQWLDLCNARVTARMVSMGISTFVDRCGLWFDLAGEEVRDIYIPRDYAVIDTDLDAVDAEDAVNERIAVDTRWTFASACLDGFEEVPRGIVNLALGCLQSRTRSADREFSCVAGSPSEPYFRDVCARYGWPVRMAGADDMRLRATQTGFMKPTADLRMCPVWVVACAGMLLRGMVRSMRLSTELFHAMCDGVVVRGSEVECPPYSQFGVVWETRWKPMKEKRLLAEAAALWSRRECLNVLRLDIRVVLGPAGSGKSTWIREESSRLGAACVVCAPTNLAARNVGGVTIHSLFGILGNYQKVADACRRVARYSTVIIDECSMIGRCMLDQILRVCSMVNVAVVFVGDPDHQLEPVSDRAVDWRRVGVLTELVGNHRAVDSSAWEISSCSRADLYASTLVVCWRNSTVDRLNSGSEYAGWICLRGNRVHAKGEFVACRECPVGEYERVRAVTCHKVQGQTLDHVLIHPELEAVGGRLLYVARTRARYATWRYVEDVDMKESEEYVEYDYSEDSGDLE